MKVILLERVGRAGHIGDEVTVKDGFARNFLLPQGKALRANEANKKKFEGQRAQLEARNLERKSEAQSIADTLDGKSFVVVRSAGETGQLYGSVSTRDIAEILTAEGFSVARNQVELNHPIKTIGLHNVTLHLHAEVELQVELNVARSAEEAERQAKGESLTSADAIYGVDEDALRPEDFFDPEADLTHGRTSHGDVIERKQEGVSEGAARHHRVAIDTVIANALPRTGEQPDVRSFGQTFGIPVERQALAVRDARMRILELTSVDTASRKQVADRNSFGG